MSNLTAEYEARIKERDRLWYTSAIFTETDESQRDRHALLAALDVARDKLNEALANVRQLQTECNNARKALSDTATMLTKERDQGRQDAADWCDMWGRSEEQPWSFIPTDGMIARGYGYLKVLPSTKGGEAKRKKRLKMKPSYDHSPYDSIHTPCPICFKLMKRKALRRLVEYIEQRYHDDCTEMAELRTQHEHDKGWKERAGFDEEELNKLRAQIGANDYETLQDNIAQTTQVLQNALDDHKTGDLVMLAQQMNLELNAEHDRALQAETECNQLQKRLDRRVGVQCLFCGHTERDVSHEKRTQRILEHMRNCPLHPLRGLEHQLDATNERMWELHAELEKLKKGHDPECDGTDHKNCSFNCLHELFPYSSACGTSLAELAAKELIKLRGKDDE